MKIAFLCAAALVSALLAPVAGRAASFDCTAARAPDEIAVCGAMALSDLDVRMATLYEVSSHLVGMGQRGMLQDQQRAFLAARSACGAQTSCLVRLYDQRINALQDVLRGIYSRGPY